MGVSLLAQSEIGEEGEGTKDDCAAFELFPRCALLHIAREDPVARRKVGIEIFVPV